MHNIHPVSLVRPRIEPRIDRIEFRIEVMGDNDHTLKGGAGNDVLVGNWTRLGEKDTVGDILEGGVGNDTLIGGQGRDTLYGGSKGTVDDNAIDYLNGGEGYDTYYAGNGDTVSDADGKSSMFFGGRLKSSLSPFPPKKNKKQNAMRIAIISVVALLGLLFPHMLLAGGEAAEFTLTSRAQKILQQAPKTTEELLQVIKVFLDNPDMNGYELGEKVSGVDRKYWTFSHELDHWGDIDIKWKSFVIAPDLPVYKKSSFGIFLIGIFQDGRVMYLDLRFPRTGADPQKSLTAAKLKAVLGKQNRFWFYRQAGESHARYDFTYGYSTKQYRFYIRFHSKDKTLIESGTLDRYETHKNIPAYAFSIQRTTKTALPTHK